MLLPLVRRYSAATLAVSVLSACGGGTEPEPAVRLSMSTQPVGSVTGAPLATQPSVVALAASGRTASGASNSVTATLNGVGTLAGTTTVGAIDGIARFADLRVIGSGSFTLTFASPGLAPTTSASFVVASLPATHLGILSQPSGSNSGSVLPVAPTVALLDDTGSPATDATTPVTASVASGTGTLSGTLTVTPASGIASFGNLMISGAGQHSLRFTAGAVAPAVTTPFVVLGPAASLSFETHRVLLNAGGTYVTAPVLRDAAGDVLSSAPIFVSRGTSVVTVDSHGALTAVAKGQAVVRASVPSNAAMADSMLVAVAEASGPALYTSFTGFTVRPDSDITVTVYMDTRASGRRIASGQVDVHFAPGQLTYLGTVPNPSMAPAVNDGSASSGVVRLSFASTAGFDGVTPIAQISFHSSSVAGTIGSLQLVASELTASDFTDLLASVVQVTQPMVVR